MSDTIPPQGLPLSPTARQVFDRVATHMMSIRQLVHPVSIRSCRYRDGDLRCAIGCLIPDEVYSPTFESNAVQLLIDSVPWFTDSGLTAHARLLNSLQFIHDTQPTEDWLDELTWLADRHQIGFFAREEMADV